MVAVQHQARAASRNGGPVVVITLSDGRRQTYAQLGDPEGLPVVVLHGTPGSWRQVASLSGPAEEHGLLLIAPDRAGYGGSSHDPGRTLVSSATDIGELLTQLGVGEARIVGISGGGPTALACGAVLARGVLAVATIGSPAPLVPRDPSLPPDRLVTRTARRSELCTRALFALMVRTGRRHPDKLVERLSRHMSEADRRTFRDDAELRKAFSEDLRSASASTARAAARDFWLFAHRWDFDLAEVSVPVQVWHGSEDRNVPVAHSRVIAARCPTAQLHIVAGGGHMLIDRMEEIVASLGLGNL